MNAFAYMSRASIRATCPDARHRDGKKAIESATKACELTAWMDPTALSTLAAACAQAGDFDAAVKWQSKSIDLFTDAKDKQDQPSRLKLYQRKRPYRDTPLAQGR